MNLLAAGRGGDGWHRRQGVGRCWLWPSLCLVALGLQQVVWGLGSAGLCSWFMEPVQRLGDVLVWNPLNATGKLHPCRSEISVGFSTSAVSPHQLLVVQGSAQEHPKSPGTCEHRAMGSSVMVQVAFGGCLSWLARYLELRAQPLSFCQLGYLRV